MSEENVKRKVLSVLSVEHQGILPRVTGLFSLLKLEDVIKVEALEMENCSNSELLLIKVRTGPAGRAGLLRTAQTYGGRVLDVGDCTMTLELSGQTEEIEGFVARMAADYGIVELARTGITALRRGDDTIHSPD